MTDKQLYIPLDFWFNQNIGLAFPVETCHLPYDGWKGQRDIIRNKRLHAVNTLFYWWKRVCAYRRLTRLRICNELELIPDFGIKYYQLVNKFNQNKD